MTDATCAVDGCSKLVKARGWCAAHYGRWLKHGSPHTVLPTGRTASSSPPIVCSIDGCDGLARTRGWCSLHYLRWRNHDDPLMNLRPDRMDRMLRPPGICSVDECIRKREARGYCKMHYARMLAKGTTEPPRRRTVCSITDCEDKEYALRYCRTHYVRLKAHGNPNWLPVKRVPDPRSYKFVMVRGKKILEHRHVMAQMLGRPLTADENVHHMNGSRQDNRPENLELWTKKQPSGQRVSDKITYAVEMLTLYASHLLV